MVSVKKITLATVAACICLSVAVVCAGGLFSVRRASAYDGLPGEFGNIVGEAVADTDGTTYVNYQRGYVKYAAGVDTSDPKNATAHVGGKNAVQENGQVKLVLIDADTMTSVKNWDTIVDANAKKNRIAYGAGWNADAAKAVGNAFKAKWQACIADGYNLGIPRSDINVFKGDGDGDAMMFALEFRYGDSVHDPDDGNGGGKNPSTLIYNTLTHEVHLVTDGFMRLIPGETRRIGAPVSEQIDNATVTGWDGESNQLNVQNGTVQVFETGILVADSKDAQGKVTHAVKHEGVVEKISDTEYVMHPLVQDQDVLATGKGEKVTVTIDGQERKLGFVGDIDGTWHALRTARTYRTADDKLAVQYNFRAGCVEVVYNSDYTISSRMSYAGQNFAYDSEGKSRRVALPIETFTADEHLWDGNVQNEALAYYRSFEGNEQKTADDLKEAFRQGYKALFDEGIIAGYRCSNIKMWTWLVVDYKYSPHSSYGFDGTGSAGRERMFTLSYSGRQDKVYGVGNDMWQIWKEDGTRPALGAPVSNEMKNKTISGKTFARIQIFEKGYVYENAAGKLITEFGATTDNDYTQFIYDLAPKAPDRYGAQTNTIRTAEHVYINYERGAVKATPSVTGMGYVYQNYPGRNFAQNEETVTLGMLPYETLYKDSEFKCDGAYNDIFDAADGAKKQIQDLIKKLLSDGVFPGFIDSQGFAAWNDVACMQLFYGDSTAIPFGGDSRTNVGAFIWNERMKEIFFLKDAFMDMWGGQSNGYRVLVAPASNEYTLPSNPNVIFQKFEDKKAEDGNAFAVSVGYNAATYVLSEDGITPDRYLQALNDLNDPLTGITIVPPEFTEFYLEDVPFMDFEYEIEGGTADAQITVTSSNEKIAKVMEDGTVEFYKAGTVTITVRVSDGVHTFSDTVTFTVKSKEKSGCGSAAASASLPIAAAALAAAAAVVLVKKKARNAR